ncbi:MAG: YHS domain-containing protein [Chloroflexi bacterium]|nr:YHS domain-containing protein [Chloroflexota bacterium]
MARDFVCRMAISENTAKEKSVYQAQTYYFCSAFCKQLFDREPQKFVSSLMRA